MSQVKLQSFSAWCNSESNWLLLQQTVTVDARLSEITSSNKADSCICYHFVKCNQGDL